MFVQHDLLEAGGQSDVSQCGDGTVQGRRVRVAVECANGQSRGASGPREQVGIGNK